MNHSDMMKYSFLLIFTFITVTKVEFIHCHVTDRVKNVDQVSSETTQLPLNDTRNVGKEISEKKIQPPKQVTDEENSIYLDDVLYSLKNQNWSEEEIPCIDQIYRLLYNLKNFTLWAVWEWDAQASEPQGLLYGNQYQLGNFDQCLNPPWAQTHPELKTKYCLADIILERTDKAIRHRVESPYPYQSTLDFMEYRPAHTRPNNEIVWGACMPRECEPATIERLMGIMLARSHLGSAGFRPNITINYDCQSSDKEREYDALFYAFFGVTGSLAMICIVCTYFNCRKKKLNPNSIKTAIIKAFCLRENSLDLLRMKKEGLQIFYGIRFLSICVIVANHLMGITHAGPTSDGISLDLDLRKFVGTLLLHNDLFVDTFFMMSGFFMITSLAKMSRLPNLFFIILKRYVRLVIALAVVIFYVAAVLPHSGSGPLWNRGAEIEAKLCRKNWWLNLLMVSNYVDTENVCLLITWYIPCDFHFFVVTLVVFFMYKKWRILGLAVGSLLTVAAIILPGVINYIYNLSAVQLFTYEFLKNPRASEEFNKAYIKSHTRFGAYLVGIYCGYFHLIWSDKGKKISQKWSILGVLSAAVLMLAVMIVGSLFLWSSYSPLESAIYAALQRPAWALGLGLIVFCCSFGQVPLMTSILTWYPWVPLSRLAYGLYLTHTVLIIRTVFSARNPQHTDFFDMLNSSAGFIFFGNVAALLIWLLAEAPVIRLLGLLIHPKVKQSTTNDNDSSPSFSLENASVETIPTSSKTQLQENLPDTLHYSSKI